MVEYKTPGEIDAMHAAGQVLARILAAVRDQAAPGVRLAELDATARVVLAEARATSPFFGYQPAFAGSPYPAVLCASVNDAALHDIPGRYRLADGDLLSIDCGATLDGWTGDAAISFIVGTPDPADEKLIAVTEEALAAGIAAAAEGARLGDISHAIGTLARGAGYGVPEGFGGHGIGRHMHEDPHVPNEGRPGRGMRLRRGLVLAIEPMLMAGGGSSYETAPDGWALKTVDGTRAAHAEHTVAITKDGPRILTLL